MVDRLASSAWWVRVLAVYATTRLLTFLLFLVTAAFQGDNYWTKANPNYFDFLNIWDVEWFGKIYAHGYPTVLPLAENGTVVQNEWAFMPGFPTAVHAFDFLPDADEIERRPVPVAARLTLHALLRVIDRLVCMDAGTVLAQGDPQTVMNDPRVVEAYLGGVPA